MDTYHEILSASCAVFHLPGDHRESAVRSLAYEGKRGHTPSYDFLMEDIAIFLDRVANAFPRLTVTLYGHSMGGNLVLNYVIRRQPVLARNDCKRWPFI